MCSASGHDRLEPLDTIADATVDVDNVAYGQRASPLVLYPAAGPVPVLDPVRPHRLVRRNPDRHASALRHRVAHLAGSIAGSGRRSAAALSRHRGAITD